MWSDNETAVDLLNVQHIVAAVLSVVRDPRLSPITVGVYGDWGSGKSSVIRMVRAELDADPTALCVYFNGWLFEGYEDAKVALASTILEAVQTEVEREGGKLASVDEPTKGRLRRLFDRVDRLRLARAAGSAVINAGLAAGGVALAAHAGHAAAAFPALAAAAMGSLATQTGKIDGDAVIGLIKEQEKAEQREQRETRNAVRDFQAEFEQLVAQLGLKRLVVVVDDLDRCLPPSVVDTFEAIRLFLSVPNTAFVIAADEGVIRHAVATRFPAYEEVSPEGGVRKVDVGVRYLEKFVQVPVRVPPLSPGDLHGYLNLLFAEKHAKDAAAFPEFCAKVRAATGYDQVAFRADEAERLLDAPPSEDLKNDLALAERIAPVLARSAEGNPRQTKRFLNALLLRLEMAKARGVTLDRAVAAKLLLLEYFQPQVFNDIARSAADAGGKPPEMAALEAAARAGASDAGSDDPLDGAADRATRPATMPSYTVSLLLQPQTKAWFAAEPRLAGVDLRPYVHFSAERFLTSTGADERLSPNGQKALVDLRSASDALQKGGAKALASLKLAEANVVIAALTKDARGAEDLRADPTPLNALYRIAEARPEAAPDVLRAIGALPASRLPSGVAVRVADFGKAPNARAVALQVLERWEAQSGNKGLRTSAAARRASLLAAANGTGH